jgi:hypothetical protein
MSFQWVKPSGKDPKGGARLGYRLLLLGPLPMGMLPPAALPYTNICQEKQAEHCMNEAIVEEVIERSSRSPCSWPCFFLFLSCAEAGGLYLSLFSTLVYCLKL